MRGRFRGPLNSSDMSPHGGGLIGGPKEPPVLSFGAYKDIGLRVRRGWGCKGAAVRMARVARFP